MTTSIDAAQAAEGSALMSLDSASFLALRGSWVAAGRPTQGHPYCDVLAEAEAERLERNANPRPVMPLVRLG